MKSGCRGRHKGEFSIYELFWVPPCHRWPLRNPGCPRLRNLVAGAIPVVVVVCVDGSRLSTVVQEVEKPRAARPRILMMMVFMVISGLIDSNVGFPTTGSWSISLGTAMGYNPHCHGSTGRVQSIVT